jgi:hypothetical protein
MQRNSSMSSNNSVVGPGPSKEMVTMGISAKQLLDNSRETSVNSLSRNDDRKRERMEK